MTVLITGGTGSLGIELKKIFPENISPTHEELDITSKNFSRGIDASEIFELGSVFEGTSFKNQKTKGSFSNREPSG